MRANVFIELGIALGQNAPWALLMHESVRPPADVAGLRAIKYTDHLDLQNKLSDFLRQRLVELRGAPKSRQSDIYQKMQIDATWRERLNTASKSLSFFAGDVSWVGTYREELSRALERGVTMRACCAEPAKDELRKWQNIDALRDLECEVKLVGPLLDPRVRGFIVDAEDMNQNTEILVVDKETRQGGRTDYERNGVTVGESLFLYHGRVYRFNEESRVVGALCRLFGAVWEVAKNYKPRKHQRR